MKTTILPCEVAVKSVVPAVKALMARELVDKHGLKQYDVAEILGISQSAVSKYSGRVRGHVIEVEKVEQLQPLVSTMTLMVMNGDYQRAEFLELFCQACLMIRKTGIVCRFCRKSDQKINIEKCGFCLRIARL